MMAAPRADCRANLRQLRGSGFPAATRFAGSAHSRTRMRSARASRGPPGLTSNAPPPSRSSARRSIFASDSSAFCVSSTQCLAASKSPRAGPPSSQLVGSSRPSRRSSSAASRDRSRRRTRAISAAHLDAHAGSPRTPRPGMTDRWAARGARRRRRGARRGLGVVGRSARAGAVPTPRERLSELSPDHACAAATDSFSRRADVTSSGPRGHLRHETHASLRVRVRRSASAATTRFSRSSPSASALAKTLLVRGGSERRRVQQLGAKTSHRL